MGVAPWKARRLAQATHRLSAEAAAYVDAQLVERIDSCGAVLIDRTIAHGLAPDRAGLVRLALREYAAARKADAAAGAAR